MFCTSKIYNFLDFTPEQHACKSRHFWPTLRIGNFSLYFEQFVSFLCNNLLKYTGLHNLFHPTIPDGSTWSKFGAHGEH